VAVEHRPPSRPVCVRRDRGDALLALVRDEAVEAIGRHRAGPLVSADFESCLELIAPCYGAPVGPEPSTGVWPALARSALRPVVGGVSAHDRSSR